jgi:RNA polymerase sigma-70 factor (ECF subfamily)
MTDTDDSLATRETLLGRLRDLDDQESWRVFFDRYWRLIYNMARKSGLTDSDAEDVVQDTVIAVAQQMPGFRYDPARGSFKQWLLRITRCRIMDHLRKLYRAPKRTESLAVLEEEDGAHALDSTATDTQFETAWDEEWERARFEAAVAEVRRQANPKHFQVFYYCVMKGWPASKAATTLGVSVAQVYLAKHRIGQSVKAALRKLARVEEFRVF